MEKKEKIIIGAKACVRIAHCLKRLRKEDKEFSKTIPAAIVEAARKQGFIIKQ